MLYDSRWDKRSDRPPSGGSDRSWFLLVLLVPVFIVASTLADALDDIRLFVLPVATNVGICLWSWMRDRS